jgi:hypothetical protein
MTKYAVTAYVTVLRKYETVVTREAPSPEEAKKGAHWEALGLSYEFLERLCDTEPHQTRVLDSFTYDVGLEDPDEADEADDDGEEEDDRDG